MSSSTGPDLSRMMPGMDFLQSLMAGAASSRGAGSAAAPPWLLPTLDLDELDKRIQDLKTVQFWLEQNARLLATTIQTLEVQRMTVATLKGLNVTAADLMKGWTPAAAPGATESESPAAAPAPAAASSGAEGADGEAGETPAAPDTAAAEAVGAGVQQALQWWQQVQQQFGQLAAVGAANAAAAAATAQAAEPAAEPPAARKRTRRTAASAPRRDA
jgi:hypothetical protein